MMMILLLLHILERETAGEMEGILNPLVQAAN
jgi:hypothetical protein